MRHLVLALMIALLPLRGWVGDAMATTMATAATTATPIETFATKKSSPDIDPTVVAVSADLTGATSALDHKNTSSEPHQAMPDCHGQLASQSDTDASASDDLASSSHDSCQSCLSCQACHTVALSPSALDVIASFASPTLRSAPAATFTSATTALGQKPPIY